jgi:hypothetical protein
MTISEKAMELENRSIGSNVPPVLGAAYELPCRSAHAYQSM